MEFREFLVVGFLCGIIGSRLVLGEGEESNSRGKAVARDGRVTVSFGDLLVEIRAPKNREGVINVDDIDDRWVNEEEDIKYWESIYGSTDDIPAFEELPEINCKTVQLRLAEEGEKEEEYEDKNQQLHSQGSSKLFSNVDEERAQGSPIEEARKNLHPDPHERRSHLLDWKKSWSRGRRAAVVKFDEKEDKKNSPIGELAPDEHPDRCPSTNPLEEFWRGKKEDTCGTKEEMEGKAVREPETSTIFTSVDRKINFPTRRASRNEHSDSCRRVNPFERFWRAKQSELEEERRPESDREKINSMSRWKIRLDYSPSDGRAARSSEVRRGSRRDSTDGCDITSVSDKLVDSAINASIQSGASKRTRREYSEASVNGAEQLPKSKQDLIDSEERVEGASALGSVNNAGADGPEQLEAVRPASIDGGLEAIGNSVLNTNSGIINVDAETSAFTRVDTELGSVDKDEATVRREIISNAGPEVGLEAESREKIVRVVKEDEGNLEKGTLGNVNFSCECEASSENNPEVDYLGGGKVFGVENGRREVRGVFFRGRRYRTRLGGCYEDHERGFDWDGGRRSLAEAEDVDFCPVCGGIVGSLARRSDVVLGRSRSGVHSAHKTSGRGDDVGSDLVGASISGANDKTSPDGAGGARFRSSHRPRGYYDSAEDFDYDSEEHREYRRRLPGVRGKGRNDEASGIGGRSEINKSLDVDGVESDGDLNETKSSVVVNPLVGIQRSRSNNRPRGNYHSAEDFDYDSEEYTEYRRRFPAVRGRGHNDAISGIDVNPLVGIQRSKSNGDFGRYYNEDEFDYDSDEYQEQRGRLSGGRVREFDSNRANQKTTPSPSVAKASESDSQLLGSTRQDKPEEELESLEDVSSEYIKSASETFADANPDQTPNSSESDLTSDVVNSDPINSSPRNFELDKNADEEFSGAATPPQEVDSPSNKEIGGDDSSEVVGTPRTTHSQPEEAALGRGLDFGKHDVCPLCRFDETRGEASYICDNCRSRFYDGSPATSSNCGSQGGFFRGRRPFSPSGTIYHFGSFRKNRKRTVDPSEGNELHLQHPRAFNSHINLDANCSSEAHPRDPDCQSLNRDLETSRDGNPVSLGFVRTHLSHGHDIALDMHERARSLAAGGLHPLPHTASMLHFFQSRVPDDLVRLNEESELTLFGTRLLQHRLSVDYDVTPNNFLEFLNHHGFRVTGNRICRGRRKRCGACDKFRSIDGSCNNVLHPTWGRSNRAFARILPARYSDGVHGMPVSVTGADLPNPRKLSVRLYTRGSKPDPELSLAVMQWGQTLAHDLGRQVMDQTTEGGIECCADNGRRRLPKNLQHHSCAPISISSKDRFYGSHGQRCMNFIRAMTVSREDCTLGPADQLNGATSFIDCSPVYGADRATSDSLREFSGGRMKVEFRSGRWMLPTMTNRSNFCDIRMPDDICYRTGDPRNNQNPQLVILQTMFVREHNRLAAGLADLNPHWEDERIFQEARRIFVAQYQHITYNEWLPLVLGRRYAKKHGLLRANQGMSDAYDERINPTTVIGFTSGAFRSLHSMIDGDIGLCNVEGKITNNFKLSDHYFRPKVIEKNNNFEDLLRGLAVQHLQTQDMNLHNELTEYLFRSGNKYGMDLAAIDIQRGRDHGLPGYNAYRKICRLEQAEDFDDLSEDVSRENIEKLRRDYAHVDDIDLIVGATMENRVPGSKFGPTNLCLIAEQFYRSRVGDRYFYDNANFSHSFTPEQLDEIRKASLSRLMCDMGGAVTVVQRNAFRTASPKNPVIPCEHLPKLDLTLWKE